MKKLQIISFLVLIITVIGSILRKFVFIFPDWMIRGIGILMLVSIFTMVFSSRRLQSAKTKS